MDKCVCSKSISILIPTHPGFVPHPPFLYTINYYFIYNYEEKGDDKTEAGTLEKTTKHTHYRS